MKAWLTLLIAGAFLTGCATTPTPDPWADVDAASEPAQRPLHQGGFPLPSDVEPDRVIYDQDGVRHLEEYRTIAEGNYAIALEHAQQIDQLRDAAGHLVEEFEQTVRIDRFFQKRLLEIS